MSQDAVDALVKLLDLEPIEVNIFRGLSPDEERQRVFGGQVAGQALVAAARTVEPGRSVHSLHAYFLRPGDPHVPILYEVDRIRDGRSFTTRRVVAIQHGKAIFNLQSSFQVPEEGLEHEAPMPEVPDPETLPDFTTRMAPVRRRRWARGTTGPGRSTPATSTAARPTARSPCRPYQQVWLRADGTLPDDPVLHACVLTYASDMTLLDTALLPHGGSWDDEDLFMASLDHAMWFHRPVPGRRVAALRPGHPVGLRRARPRAGAASSRPTGDLAVTVVQEGLIRVVRR